MNRRLRAAGTLGAFVCLVLFWVDGSGDQRNPKSEMVKRPPSADAAVGAYVLGPRTLIAGSSATYRVVVHWASAPGKTGALAGARVRLELAAAAAKGKRTLLARARTDRLGNAQLDFVVPKKARGEQVIVITVEDRLGTTTERQDVRIYPGGRVLLTTDKALYQPAQTIHIRTLALRSIDLRPVARQPIKIQVKDPKGNIVYLKSAKTSSFGVASLDFKLADEILLGRYVIAAWVEGSDRLARVTRGVRVERYTLPKMKVHIETDRSYYQAGETLRGTVRSKYFFGKPVVGGRVSIDVRTAYHHGRVVSISRVPSGQTDRQGRRPFEVKLSRRWKLGKIRVTATVVDKAGQRRAADLELPLTDRPLRLGIVPESSRLIPGVLNRVHVIAGYPDGSVASGVQIAVGQHRRRTDKLGIATFSLSARGRPCRSYYDDRGVRLAASAVDRLGQRGATTSCVPLAAAGTPLVRPRRSLVSAGESVLVDLQAAAGSIVHLDVVKAGQTLATFSRALRSGRKATLRFMPSSALFGLLELRAYRVSGRDGRRRTSSRMVYIEHPGHLRITAKPNRASYRPGERARIRFRTVDSRTGDGVQAALGLVAIDDAVVALGGLQRRSNPKIFFTLASQANRHDRDLKSKPGGRELDRWLERSTPSEQRRRERAVDVLLAAVQPAASSLWETNPWQQRRERWAAQAPRLIVEAKRFLQHHSVGRRTKRGWRFVPDLLTRMVRAGAIKQREDRDPWQRIVRPWHLRKTDRSFAFAPLASSVAKSKLYRIYDQLALNWTKLNLAREQIRKLPKKKWPLVLPRGLPAMLAKKAAKLKPTDVIDPWGNPFEVVRVVDLFIDPYDSGLVSRYQIRSAGPDEKLGTRDDIRPRGRRVRVAVARGGSLLALAAADRRALGRLVGDAIGETYGSGGLGMRGSGRGGGGVGEGTIGLGTLGTIGRGGGGAGLPDRVRSRFPETLLWQPQLVTGPDGRGSLDVDLADSITTWRLLATGSTRDGLLGSTSVSLRVFQDFFVEVELPATLTQGDRISVPVTVYNYLKTPQRVTLKLDRERWFTVVGNDKTTIKLGPSQVGVRYFTILARRTGRHDLTVRGRAGSYADAVRRTASVLPDGVEQALVHSGTLQHTAAHALTIPAMAIEGTAHVAMSISPGPAGDLLTGMESMLRKPHGCFEQTSSTTYPNVLLVDYLKRTRQLTPKLARRAKALINDGYQRLLRFEVEGGGFSWFGNAPANQVLTAYGLMEFKDMARVFPVDPKLIERTQRWLASKQRADGSWAPDKQSINEGATNKYRNDLRVTAYITHALRRTGYRGEALARALRYVRRRAAKADDAYTLALLGNLFANDRDRTARMVLNRLWAHRKSDAARLYFDLHTQSTLTNGAGRSGRIEVTALAALAYLSRSTNVPEGLDRVIESLVASRDRSGSWHSTQATILTLRALLKDHQRSQRKARGEVELLVDGRKRSTIRLQGAAERYEVDLTPHAGSGTHQVALRFAGQGRVSYQLVGRYWLPRRKAAARSSAGEALAIETTYNRRSLKRGGRTLLTVVIRNKARAAVQMPMVALSLPPGFELEQKALVGLVGFKGIEKIQRRAGQALLYLSLIGPRQQLGFSLPLRSKYPLRVQARSSLVYEYYKPENRAESAPSVLQVL